MRRFEDFVVGATYRSAVGRTVTESDNLLYTMLAMNTNELHFNDEAARASEWGKPLVNSTFTLALVLGLSVADTARWLEGELAHGLEGYLHRAARWP
jgi:itaconyl-CoA hydratase